MIPRWRRIISSRKSTLGMRGSLRNIFASARSKRDLVYTPTRTVNSWCALNGTRQPSPHIVRRISTSSSSVSENAGLFGNPLLQTPTGFDLATKKAIAEASNMVDEISRSADKPSIKIIQKFDELSDVLCRVADLAECIRQVHPESRVAEKAEGASIAINNYVEELNTCPGLHRALKSVIESEEFSKFDEVTQRTADLFMHDFEISGIHLDGSTRERVVKLNSQILELSHQFMHNTNQPTLVEASQCPPFMSNRFPSDSKLLMITHVPFSDANSQLRALSYLLYYAIFPKHQEVLEKLLSLRHELATVVGYPTFAHRVLKSSMAEDPQTVTEFLEALSSKILPLARKEAKQMQKLKLEFGNQVDPQVLRPWDTVFVDKIARDSLFPEGFEKGMENWFSVDACLNGLGHLFQSLFGVKLESVSVKNRETWDPHVRKLAFVDETEGLLGYTYCDLFHRPRKLASECHFTIQGGRGLTDGTYQMPIIALCCNFNPPVGNRPAVLPQNAVENLFHEMGHALHSMLGRPKYQNVTGTRCSTDFAEVPSILMEYFLYDSRVLSSFANHYATKEPLPTNLKRGFQLSRSFFPAFDLQMSVMYSIMDQKFHSKLPLGRSTVELFADLHMDYAPLEYIPQTAWFLRFGHLFGYAAKYYAYLWSRAVASLIWKTCFKADPFSREAGEKYREMLMNGGGIHPITLVRNMLGFEPTVSDLVEALYCDVVEHQEQIAEEWKQIK